MVKQALNAPGLWKIKHDREWNEYVVIHPTNPRAHYHTDDKEDAIGTRAHMMKHEQAKVDTIDKAFN